MCLRDGQKRKRVCGSPELQGIGKSVWLKNHVEKKRKDSRGFVGRFAQKPKQKRRSRG